MKKFLLLAMSLAAALFFFSCATDDDDSDSSSSSSSNVSAISAKVETESVGKSASFSEQVTVDLSDNPLKSDVVSSLAEGADVTEFFRQSAVDASASRAATAADDDGLKNFKATLRKITKVSLEVTITGTTPDEDCSILITAVVSAEKTESGKTAVSLVKKVDVGNVPKVSASTFNLSGKTIPTATDMKNKILRFNDEDTYRIKYYKFSADGKSIEKWRYYLDEEKASYSDNPDKSSTSYTYNGETGEITEVDDDGEADAMRTASGGNEYLMKVDGSYYIFDGMKLERSSGSGLDSTFTYKKTISADKKVTTDDGKTITVYKCSESILETINTTSSGALTGALNVNGKLSYTKEGKEFMKNMYEKLYEGELTDEEIEERLADQTYSDVFDITGVYTNENGVFTVRGKTIGTVTDEEGTKTEIEEFDNGVAFYDGTNIYFGETLSEVTEADMKAGK